LHAYHELEMRAADLEARQKLARRARWRGLALVFGLLLAIQGGILAWLEQGATITAMVASLVAGTPDQPAGRDQPRLDLVTVESQFVERDIGLIGKIDPGHVYDITAPFDGTITQIGFAFGARVERGQELLRLAIDELEKQQRDAEVALIEASSGLEEIKNWEASSEVADARRSLAAAEESRAISLNRLEGTLSLYEAGVLSREELDQAESSLADAERSADAARDSLAASIRKGSETNVHVAELKLKNAEAEVKDIEAKIAQASVRSPASGVALKPLTEGSTGENPPVALGTGVTARQLLLSIGDMESLSIEASVSELDIDAVTPGLAVEVRTEILGDQILPAVVESTASQAAPDDFGSVLARYPITVRITELTPFQRSKLRLGMSAELRVIVYRNPDALVIPHEAVAGDGDSWYVRRLEPATGRVSDVPITLGRSLPDGLEVLEGLNENDQILRDPEAARGKEA
jgi:multidrug efflux pump subunit AcrA (membrane-fusion protein)